MIKKYLKFFIILITTCVVFYLLFRQIDLDSVWNIILHANIWWLLATFSVILTYPIFGALRWRIILNSMGFNLKFWKAFKIVMGAWSLSSVTPSKAGDLIRANPIKNSVPISKTAGSILIERVFDVLLLLILALIGGIVYNNAIVISIMAAGLVAVFLFFILAKNINKIKLPIKDKHKEKLNNIFYSSKILLKQPKQFIQVALITLLNWLGTFLQVYFLYLALGIQVSFVFICLILPIALFIGILPVTLAGMGTRDSAIVYLFASVAPASINLSMGILYSIFGYWIIAILGLFFLKSLSTTKEQIDHTTNILPGKMYIEYHQGRLHKKAFKYRLKRRGSEVVKMIKKYSPKSQSILDLGAADGLAISEMKKLMPNCKYNGIEISTELIEANNDPEINILQGNVEQIDLPDNQFDVVSACALIEHIENPDKMIKEAQRVLKNNGLFIITTPVPFFDKIAELIKAVPGEHHVQLYNFKKINTLLEKQGFNILENKKFMIAPAGIKYEILIENTLTKMHLDFLMLNQLIVAQKI
jgi:glycosyltransferase 2 family protein